MFLKDLDATIAFPLTHQNQLDCIRKSVIQYCPRFCGCVSNGLVASKSGMHSSARRPLSMTPAANKLLKTFRDLGLRTCLFMGSDG